MNKQPARSTFLLQSIAFHKRLQKRPGFKDGLFILAFFVFMVALFQNLTQKQTFLSPVPMLFDPKTKQVVITDIDLIDTKYSKLRSATYTLVPLSEVVTYALPATTEAEIRAVFGKDGDDAVSVARCESHLRPQVCNDGMNSDSSVDCGIFQVNSIHGIDRKYLTNQTINIQVAKMIFDEQGWGPWRSSNSCSHVLDGNNIASN